MNKVLAFFHDTAVGNVLKEAFFVGVMAVVSSLITSVTNDQAAFGPYTGALYLVLVGVRAYLGGLPLVK